MLETLGCAMVKLQIYSSIQQTYKKMINITNYQVKTNTNHIETMSDGH